MGRPSSGGHIRKFPNHNTSYRLISVNVDGVRRQRFEHRLVMEAHLGRKLLDTEIVHHKDENGLNNDISNLEIMTQSEHQRGHLMVGAKKWDFEQALIMREKGLSFIEISAYYNVSYTTIMAFFKRRGISTKRIEKPLTWNFEEAVRLYKNGTSIRSIANQLGVSPPSIGRVFRGRNINR